MKNKKKNKASRQAGHRLCNKISKNPVPFYYKPSFHKEVYITGEHATVNNIGGNNLYTLEQSTDITGLRKLQEELRKKESMANKTVEERKQTLGLFDWLTIGISAAASAFLVSKAFKKSA